METYFLLCPLLHRWTAGFGTHANPRISVPWRPQSLVKLSAFEKSYSRAARPQRSLDCIHVGSGPMVCLILTELSNPSQLSVKRLNSHIL